MNRVAKRTDQMPETEGDPYLEGAMRALGDNHLFMKYEKGTFRAGAEGYEIRLGTEMIPNLPLAEAGWLRWQGGTVVEARMVPIAKGRYPYREELGDLDSRLWEVDDDGRPQDSWSETFALPFRDPADGQDYLFSTSSVGGRKAVGRLVHAWRHAVLKGQKGLPVITLGSDSYKHRKHGTVHFPVFEIVRWDGDPNEPASGASELGAVSDTPGTTEPEFDDEIVF